MIPRDAEFGYDDDLTLEGTTDTEHHNVPEFLPKTENNDWREELL